MYTPRALVTAYLVPQAIAIAYTAINVRAIISQCTVTNPDVSAHTVTVYKVPSGSAPDQSTVVLFQRSVAAGESKVFPEMIGKVIEAGGTIQVSASQGGLINLMVDGAEVS